MQENIYKPAFSDFCSTYLALKDFPISLGTVQSHFEKQLADESQLTKEFKIMEMSEGKGSGKAACIDAAVEKIKNYLTLSTVVNTARMIDELWKTLDLNGNFQIVNDLTKYVCRGHMDIWLILSALVSSVLAGLNGEPLLCVS